MRRFSVRNDGRKPVTSATVDTQRGDGLAPVVTKAGRTGAARSVTFTVEAAASGALATIAAAASLAESETVAFDEQAYLRLIRGDTAGAGASVARVGLSMLTPFYAAAVGTRNALFDRRLKSIRRLPLPVICVGNLTTGGTGKTPAVVWLCRQLAAAGRKPAVLTRGYKTTAGGVSDEAEELRSRLADINVGVFEGSDRYASAIKALNQIADGGLKSTLPRDDRPSIDVFVLDDGFQHRRLHRDFDLVLIDATEPFGFDRLLPRGLLREPVSALRRADAIVITRSDRVSAEALRKIETTIGFVARGTPIVHATHRPTAWLVGDEVRDAPALAGRKIAAFCALGNPAAFYATLASLGATVVETRSWPDHHDYAGGEVAAFVDRAFSAGAESVVTTEKDWTKIAKLDAATKVSRLRVEFDVRETESLVALIQSAIA